MLVPNEVRLCVGFVHLLDWDDRHRPVGTLFFLGYPSDEADRYFVYGVTAKHILDRASEKGQDDALHIRLNARDGTTRWVMSEIDNWFVHPDDSTVDVAVLPWAPDQQEFEYKIFPITGAVKDEAHRQRLGIGVGDETFITGLFVNHVGSQRNVPIIRIGNIAAMPEDPVKTAIGEMEAYLIEMRSIGGLSGSPVFVNLGLIRKTEAGIGFAPEGTGLGGPFFLLGLIHGHWEISPADFDQIVDDGMADPILVNTGIAVVIPFSKIREVLDQPKLETMRRQHEEEWKKSDLPNPDIANVDEEK